MAIVCLARIVAIVWVPTFPTANQITLGGAPCKKLSWRKSSSFDTMTKSCFSAYRQVGLPGQSNIVHVLAFLVQRRERAHQARTQVLIE